MPKAKPRISIVGAGRMGTVLGRALARAGYEIPVVITNHDATAARSARIIGAKTLGINAKDLAQASDAKVIRLVMSDVLVISTPDDVIPTVAKQLSEIVSKHPRDSNRPGRSKVALHTSGALASDILEPLRTVGLSIGSIHPLVSIANQTSDLAVFRDAFFCLEGDRQAVARAHALVADLAGKAFEIDSSCKPLYHAAAVLTAGHVVSLFDIALEMLKACGVTSRKAQAVLLPLLRSTVANLESSSTAESLTGSFARADVETIKKHLAAIKAISSEEALTAYISLGRHSLSLAKQLPLPAKRLNEIDNVLRRSRDKLTRS